MANNAHKLVVGSSDSIYIVVGSSDSIYIYKFLGKVSQVLC